MAEALRIIRERDGWRGLRRGMLPRVLTVAPSTAISWMSYEFFSEFYHSSSYVMRRNCLRCADHVTAHRGAHSATWDITRNGTAHLER